MKSMSRASPWATEMRVMPAIDRTNPTKNAFPGRGARRHSHSSRAVNMGAAEMIIPTVEA